MQAQAFQISIQKTSKHLRLAAVCVATTGLLTTAAQAQTVYRVVGADGRVTFSDKPPLVDGKVSAREMGSNPANTGSAGLPYELSQVVGKYPVTLYTSANCAPCDAGRTLLSNRGVPFAEKTVGTHEDIEAFQRMAGNNTSLPLLTIGGQQIKGFSELEWKQYLDAAAYPSSSVLPATYRRPTAAPLVPVQKPEPVKPSAKPDLPFPLVSPTPAATSPTNPAGIQF